MKCALLLLTIALAAPPANAQDFDKDGVVDIEDDCPTDPGSKASKGCPADLKPEPEPVKDAPRVELKDGHLELSETIRFRSGSASVDPRSFSLLKEIARKILEVAKDKRVIVAGHTDDRGQAKKNSKLSEDRARAVIAHLVRNGVTADHLEAQGFGSAMPIASNETEAGRNKNRRVEFTIVDGK